MREPFSRRSMPPWCSPGVGSCIIAIYLLIHLSTSHSFTYLPPPPRDGTLLLTDYFIHSLTHSLIKSLTHPHPRAACRHSHSGGPIKGTPRVPTYLLTYMY